MSRIDRVEITPFTYEVDDLGVPAHGATGVGNLQHVKGGKARIMRYAVRIRTDDGLEGAYVTHWVGTQAALGQSLMLAPHLLGRDPEAREVIYDDLKRELRAYDHMGHGPLDIALWDLAGRKYGTPVARLLGGYRWRLPAYLRVDEILRRCWVDAYREQRGMACRWVVKGIGSLIFC